MAAPTDEASVPRRVHVHDAVWVAGLVVVLIGVMLWAATVGAARIDPITVARIVIGVLPGFQTAGTSIERTIVWEFRLPRIAMSAIVGLALATAGAVMQGFFRNPMADPSIIGVSSGAAAGAVAVIALPLTVPHGIPLAAFTGAVLAGFAVYAVATRNGYTPVATLLLSGVAIQTFLGAVVSYLIIRAPDRGMREAMVWLLGSMRGSDWHEVAIVAPVAVLGAIVLFSRARDLNVLLLGERDAATLGVPVEATKRRLLAVSALITGAAVAFVGVIGFVGLIVPHVLRLLVGPDHRVLLPASGIGGAAFLVGADTIARGGPQALPVGVITAFVGAPFFLYLLRRREVHEL